MEELHKFSVNIIYIKAILNSPNMIDRFERVVI